MNDRNRSQSTRSASGGTIHSRIPVLRAERGMSRQDLAAAVGVNYQTIGYLERGDYNPSLELAFRIGEVFGLPIEAIFSREPFPPLSEQVYGRRAAAPSGGGA
ncbi:MAG: transcriptional regulator, family [Gemmatimonadetes bacterium]|nr:transcriptional regulator, family [Gemmatimonadota bacterium]